MDFKQKSEDYLKKLRLPINRGSYEDFKRMKTSPELQFTKPRVKLAPHRDDITSATFDPTTGYSLSAKGCAQKQMNSCIPTQSEYIDLKPTEIDPKTVQYLRPASASVRANHVTAEPIVQARATTAIGGPFSWHDRKQTDNVLRGKTIFSGWKDLKTGKSEYWKPPEIENIDKRTAIWKEKAVQNVVYKSSTQKQYEDLNWDVKIPPPTKPPPTTLEVLADPVSERLKTMRKMKEAEWKPWSTLALDWDKVQTRNQYLYEKRPYAYCSESRKTQQIPDYQGHTGGFGPRDNLPVNFVPIYVKRSEIPPKYGSGRSSNIPGYTGNVWWLGCLAAHNYKMDADGGIPGADVTSKASYVPFPPGTVPPSEHARRERLAKMITTVHPHNPFRRNEREEFLVDPLAPDAPVHSRDPALTVPA